MKLLEALEQLNRPLPQDLPQLSLSLVCGFTPLHLETFVAARLREIFPRHRTRISVGLFGDIAGTLERLVKESPEIVLVALEWSDLDARLGLRAVGGWRVMDLDDIVSSAGAQAHRIVSALESLGKNARVIIVQPSLPLPPIFPSGSGQLNAHQLRLREIVASMLSKVAASGARVADPVRLDTLSRIDERYDVRGELSSGFPYKLEHASAVAEILTDLLRTQEPKKGLITDLDDTLWHGLLGEIGPEGISWDLDHNSQIHAIYQQFLASIASAGFLVGIASKNDPTLVEAALERPDLHISKADIYPVAASWCRKSLSVRQILDTWNVGEDSIVFIDDSPMEVAEVQNSFPSMDCRVFPTGNPQAIWELLIELRDCFRKSSIREEDTLRLASIRAADALKSVRVTSEGTLDDFLRSAEACIEFHISRNSRDERALELINKTNQFNLNGRRWTEAELNDFLRLDGAFLLTVKYQDKFGPLGKIAILLGRRGPESVSIDTWVLSCRAFSRRIEHRILAWLYVYLEAPSILVKFEATARNGPTREFLEEITGQSVGGAIEISRAGFSSHVPPLFHSVKETADDWRF